MGQIESRKDVQGEILLILDKKNYICGELITGSVSYQVEDVEIKAFLQLICVIERYIKKKRLYQEQWVEQSLMLSQPNEKGILEKQFSIMTPQLQSTEFITWNQEGYIYIKYFLRSYLNFQDHNLKKKQRINKISEEQIYIRRSYQNKIESVLKQLSYKTKSWILGDEQKVLFWYDFQNKYFRSNESLTFWLGVDNQNSSINIENINAYLIFEILECEAYWKTIERRQLSRNDAQIKVPSGNQNMFQLNLLIPNNSSSSVTSRKIRMCYHVEIVFDFQKTCLKSHQYVERVWIDVVNCEN